jgi:hypothetical protein
MFGNRLGSGRRDFFWRDFRGFAHSETDYTTPNDV